MEDVAEKARRNLMIISTGILAVSALGIPLDGRLVGAVNLNEVEPWRAWACTFIVLAYFFVRFHRSPYFANERDKYARLRVSQLRLKCSELVRDTYRDILVGKQNTLGIVLPDPEPGFSLSPFTLIEQMVWASEHFLERKGSLKVRFEPRKEEPWKAIPDKYVEFTIPKTVITKFRLHLHWVRLRHVTWAGLETTLPMTLAAAAGLICLFKLAQSFYYSFPFVRQLLSA